jgi:hypothetical protein
MKHPSIWIGLVASLAWTQIGYAQFSFVQINTDEFGHDILGDAANEPSLAIDPTNPNRMAVGWRQFDTVTSNFRQAGVAFSANGGLTWSSSVLSPGVFHTDPVLRADADGNFYYAAVTPSSLDSVEVFKSTDGGATWGPPVYAYGGDKEWIAIDNTNGPGRGNIYLQWDFLSSVSGRGFTRSTDDAASFEFPTTGPEPRPIIGTLAVGPNGTVYSAGPSKTVHSFAKSTDAQFAGQTPTFTTTSINLGGVTKNGDFPNNAVNPAGLLGQVYITAANNGNLYVLGSVDPPGPDPLDVMFVRSTDDGNTWSSPLRVNKNPVGENSYQWFGMMDVAPNGRIDAIWNDTGVDTSNNFSVLKYAYSIDEGLHWLGYSTLTLPFNHLVGFPVQNKIGDYYDMASDDLGVNLVFSATFNDSQDVYFMRINAVPEPASVLLVTSELVAMCLGRRPTAKPGNMIGKA